MQGLPTFTGAQPERGCISSQELEMVQSCPMWLSTPEAPVPLLSTIPPSSSGRSLGGTWLSRTCRPFSGKETFD